MNKQRRPRSDSMQGGRGSLLFKKLTPLLSHERASYVGGRLHDGALRRVISHLEPYYMGGAFKSQHLMPRSHGIALAPGASRVILEVSGWILSHCDCAVSMCGWVISSLWAVMRCGHGGLWL
eukprot:Gb_14223 [translate_table: standard]